MLAEKLHAGRGDELQLRSQVVRAGCSAGEAVQGEGTGPRTAPTPMPGLGWELAAGMSPKASSPSSDGTSGLTWGHLDHSYPHGFGLPDGRSKWVWKPGGPESSPCLPKGSWSLTAPPCPAVAHPQPSLLPPGLRTAHGTDRNKLFLYLALTFRPIFFTWDRKGHRAQPATP